MLDLVNASFRLGDRIVRPDLDRIHGPDGAVDVEPKTMAVLLCLVAKAGAVVSADELIDAVWDGRPMGDNPVYKSITKLRKALGDSAHDPSFIATVPKKGYRLLRAPTPIAAGGGSTHSEAAEKNDAARSACASDVPASSLERSGVAMSEVASVAQPRAVGLPGTRGVWMAGLVLALGATLLVALNDAPQVPTSFDAGDASAAPPVDETESEATMASRSTAPVQSGSLAVLVFTDLKGSGPHHDLGDSISDEIRVQVQRIDGLSVTSRSASQDVRDRQLNPAQVRDALGVEYVVEGTVRVVDDRLHYRTRLINTANGFAEWSVSETRPYGDVLAVQDEIANAVVDALRIKLARALSRPVPNTNSVAAWEAYLLGRSFLTRSMDPVFLESAEQHFNDALSHDPGYARAYAGLCEVFRRWYRRTANTLYVDKAETACRQAEQLDPNLSEVKIYLANLYRSSGRLDEAALRYQQAMARNAQDLDSITGLAAVYAEMERADDAEALFRTAIERFPRMSTVHARFAVYLYRRGRYSEALPLYQNAYELGATNTSIVTAMGACYFMLGDFEMAERRFHESLQQKPSPNAHTNLGTTYYYLGRFGEAVEQYRAALALAPADHSLWSNLAAGLRQLPETESEVLEVCAQTVELGQQELAINPDDADVMSRIASCQALLGDWDAARTAVERAPLLSPNETNVLFNCAVALVDLGDDAGAARMLERAIEHGYPLAHAQADPMLRPALAHLQL